MNISIIIKKTAQFLKVVLEGEELEKSESGAMEKSGKGFISYLFSSEDLGSPGDGKTITDDTYTKAKPKGILSALLEKEELTPSDTVRPPAKQGFFAWILAKENIDEGNASERNSNNKK